MPSSIGLQWKTSLGFISPKFRLITWLLNCFSDLSFNLLCLLNTFFLYLRSVKSQEMITNTPTVITPKLRIFIIIRNHNQINERTTTRMQTIHTHIYIYIYAHSTFRLELHDHTHTHTHTFIIYREKNVHNIS